MLVTANITFRKSCQTMIFRLRTSHCRLRIHMKKSGIEESDICPCELLESHTTIHAMHSWSLHKEERESTWPTESSLGNKLHGTATDLRLTMRFIALTGLQIWQVHIERWRRRRIWINVLVKWVFILSLYISIMNIKQTAECQPLI